MSLPSVKSEKTPLLQRGLGVLGSLALLSNPLVVAPTIAQETLVIPDVPAPIAPAAPAVREAPAIQPVEAPQPQRVRSFESVRVRSPRQAFRSERSRTVHSQLSAPRISLSRESNTLPNASDNLQGKNSYIDNTSYKGESQQPTVVLTERSSGCQIVVQNGSLNRGCGVTASSARRTSISTSMTREAIANNRAFIPRYQRLASRPRVSAQSLISQNSGFAPIRPITLRQHNYQPYRANQEVNSSQVVSLEPIIRRGLAIALAPMPEYSRATSLYAPTAPQGESRTDLLFPLPVVAPITSAFGWRIHPIAGTGRMHSGTDIGAPLGTPVLAAYQGEVAVADWLGGYGMTVIIRHLEGTQESRYGHLSEIFVKPGQAVQQGEVIGRVGSTGFSTGPHLHFEWRHLTKEGWVAVDAGPHLEYALGNLIRTQQLANATLVKPQG